MSIYGLINKRKQNRKDQLHEAATPNNLFPDDGRKMLTRTKSDIERVEFRLPKRVEEEEVGGLEE